MKRKKSKIYIVGDESDIIWIEDNFGHDAGVSCRAGVRDYGYGNIGIRTYNGQFCGYSRLSFYLFGGAGIYKDSKFVNVKDIISSGSENDCAFECDMSNLVEA